MKLVVSLVRNQVRRAQLILLLVASLGILYVGFGVIGSSALRSPYEVTLELDTSGGLMDGSLVNYRGQRIGKVTDVRLTETGVEATLSIDKSVRVPADTEAAVLNLSAVGEQYVDLRPRVDHGPYLADGSVIHRRDTTTPTPISKVLADLDGMMRYVDVDDLETVVDELSEGIGSSGPEIESILANSDRLVRALDQTRPEFVRLIDNAGVTLDTLVQRGRKLHSFARSLRSVTQQLKSSDPDLRWLLASGQVSIDQMQWFIDHDHGALAQLVRAGDELTLILAQRTAAIAASMVALPQAGFALADIIRLGALQGKLYTGVVVACSYGTPVQNALEGGVTHDNVDRHCVSQAPDPPRGAMNAPRP